MCQNTPPRPWPWARAAPTQVETLADALVIRRRVFGAFAFNAREEVHMPPPGDRRPARMEVHMRDFAWESLYAPIERIVGATADLLNRVQFLTIRGYLTLVAGALVALLVVLAIWQ